MNLIEVVRGFLQMQSHSEKFTSGFSVVCEPTTLVAQGHAPSVTDALYGARGKTMAEPIIIHRVGHPAAEQGVRVTQGLGNVFWINPKTEVGRAIGEMNLPREGKVIAFAQGLVASGHEVFILDRRHPYEKRLLYQFKTEPTCINVLYYLYGRAWGSGQWNSLILQLHTFIVQAQWYSVYSTTARHSFNHPWEQEIRLQLPR